jgi:ribose-phosphate pyrophosphokinase
MKITKYPDGSSYVGELSRGTIVHRINSYEDLWHLNQAVDAYVSDYGKKLTVLIPNLIDAQADRRFNKHESSGLKLVCKFLNSMPVKKFNIFHPHNPEVIEALIDNVTIIDNTDFIKEVLVLLGESEPRTYYTSAGYQQTTRHDISIPKSSGELILLSSDAGGYKPLMKLADKIGWSGETYAASKSRKYQDGESKLTQIVDREDFGGRDILIVDDLCVYGGTFKGLATLLRERNVGKLYLAVSHMTIQNFKGNDTVFNYYDGVFTTNSKFDDYWVENSKGEPTQPKNLTVTQVI